MNQAERAELLEQIEKWNDADEFARCIEAIEAIPEQERDYLLTLNWAEPTAIWRCWVTTVPLARTLK